MVKRFLAARSGKAQSVSRYAPDVPQADPQFTVDKRKLILPDDAEIAANPRARSAKLRVAVRTDAPSGDIDADALAMPKLKERY
jgi:16S rRNA (cytosine1402-N4)-methyltransferase